MNSNNLLSLFSQRTNEKVKKAKNQGFNDSLTSMENLNEANTFNQTELAYNLQLLKNKSIREKEFGAGVLDEVYAKVRRTLKYAMKRLLLTRQFYAVDALYKKAEGEKQTAQNLLKLIIRVQKMQEAQIEITKILVLIN